MKKMLLYLAQTTRSLRRFGIFCLGLMVLMLIGCSDDEKSYYLLYNTDSGEEVQLYYSADTSRVAITVPSRTHCKLDSYEAGEGVATITYGYQTFYINRAYLFKKEVKGEWKRNPYGDDSNFTPKQTRFEKIKKAGSQRLERLCKKIEELQDSHFHYNRSSLWSKAGILLFALIFLWLLSKSNVEEGIQPPNRKYALLAFLAGLVILYFEFIDCVVLGGGYVPIEQTSSWDLTGFWGFFVGLALLVVVFLVVVFIFIAQVVFMPWMGHLLTGGTNVVLRVCNFLIICAMYTGAALAILLKPESFESVCIICLSLASVVALFAACYGVIKREWNALLFLLLPPLYLISIAAIYTLIGPLILVIEVMLVLLYFAFALSLKSSSRKKAEDDSGSASCSGSEPGNIAYDQNGSQLNITPSGSGGFDQYGNRYHKEGGGWTPD